MSEQPGGGLGGRPDDWTRVLTPAEEPDRYREVFDSFLTRVEAARLDPHYRRCALFWGTSGKRGRSRLQAKVSEVGEGQPDSSPAGDIPADSEAGVRAVALQAASSFSWSSAWLPGAAE